MPLIVRLAMVFAGGAIAGHSLTSHTAAVVIGALAAAPLLTFAEQREQLLLFVIAAVGIGLGALRAESQTTNCTSIPDRAAVVLRGALETQLSAERRTVSIRQQPGPHTIRPCGKSVRVRMPDDAPRLHVGDVVNVAGAWMTLRISAQPRGPFDGVLIANSVRIEAGKADGLLRARGRVQETIHQLFPAAYPLAEALLVAQRENLDADVRQSFAASGLTHLLAISGTHVALVAASLLLLARLLRCSARTATIASIAGSTAYVFFLGAPYAALRALLQMLLVFAARALQKPAHPLGLLAAAAFVITAIDPAAPLDAGFQLSFAGICGIVLWRRPLIELLPHSIPVPLRDAVATTLAATAITTPIAAFHFGVVSVIALVANLLAIPVVSVAVPAAAFAVLISGISMDAARFIGAGADLTLLWLNRIARDCALVPGGHFAVTPLSVGVGTVAAALAFHAMRQRAHCTLPGRALTALLAGTVPMIAVPLLPGGRADLQIHMIDVGQGDAFAIRTPRGRWLLVDAGPVSEKFDAGRRTVAPFLLRHQAGGIQAVLISHPHLDHFGGLAAIMEQLPVGAIVDPALPVSNPAFDSLLALAHRRHVPWLAARPGGGMEIDGVRLAFLAPASSPVDASVDPNDYSAAFRLSYGRFSALFLGDLPANGERGLVETYGQRLDVDLLKVAHHGSNGSSSPELLVATSPQVALVSAGRRNRYRHPGRRTVEHLLAGGVHVFRTDRDGTVSVMVDAHGRMQVVTGQ